MKAPRIAFSLLLTLLYSVFALELTASAQQGTAVSKLDPTVSGKVTPVRQSPMNSGLCWAYATIGSIEQNLIYSGLDNASVDLSESSLVWFSTDSEHLKPEAEQRYSNSYIISPVFAMSRLSGIQDERDEPMYLNTPHLNPVSYSQNGLCTYELEKMEKIRSDKDTIKKKILEYGGAAVCYYNDDSCFSSDHKSYFQRSGTKENHSVTVIGWDDDYSRDNFGDIKPDKNGAWLVKGVWGTRHENGFYWISYEEPEMMDFYFYKVTSPRSDKVYSHNNGSNMMYASAKNTIQAANVFTAGSDEKLEEISFLVADNGGEGTDYTIKVYKGLKDASPVGNVLCTEIKGNVVYDGYYSIKLPSAVSLSKDEKFSVVVSLRSKNGHNYFVCEDAQCYAHEGESYYCNESGEWLDCLHTQFRNAYINAYTTLNAKPSEDHLKELVDKFAGTKGMQRAIDKAKTVLEKQNPSYREISYAEKLIEAASNECSSYTVITTVQQWNEFAKSVNDGNQYRDKTVVVEADLDFKGKDFVCAGISEDRCFNGYFDANGHTFSNFTLSYDIDNNCDQRGIFGYIGVYANITNLVAVNADVSTDKSGGIVGVCDCGTITCCGFNGKLSGKDCAGIVGELKKGTISDCYSIIDDKKGSGIAAVVNPKELYCVRNCFSNTSDDLSQVRLVNSSEELVKMLDSNGGDNKSFEHFFINDSIVRPLEYVAGHNDPDTQTGKNSSKPLVIFISLSVVLLTAVSIFIIRLKRKKR